MLVLRRSTMMIRCAVSASETSTIPVCLRSRALAGMTCRCLGQPAPRSTRDDGAVKPSNSCAITQAAEGTRSSSINRRRDNNLLFWSSMTRNLSSNVPLATSDERGEPQQNLEMEGVANVADVSASAVDAGQGLSTGSDERMGITANGTAAAASQPSHTVVDHPPAPGWEYPPVPVGCEPKFAIIRLGNTQHKVTKDDVIVAEKIPGDIGTTVEVTDVLLVGRREDTIVGRPIVSGASVKLFIEEQTLDKKVIVFKKRRRKASKTTQGHRRHVTILRVTDILD